MESNSDLSEPNPKVESKTFLADVHYFISVPEDRPLHSRFEKAQVVQVDTLLDTNESRISFFDSTDLKSCTLTGSLSLMQPEYDERQETCVHIELDYGEDLGASLEWDWMMQAHNIRNDGLQNYRPFCLDIYFWTRTGAQTFLEKLRTHHPNQTEPGQVIYIQQKVKDLELPRDEETVAALEQAVLDTSHVESPIVPTVQSEEPAPHEQENNIDPDEEEVLQINMTSLKCFSMEHRELQALNGAKLRCRITRNRNTNDVHLLVINIFDYGTVDLIYKLSERSFPYQLPDFTVQVRFLNVEKVVKTRNEGDDRLDFAHDASCIDSPVFRFEHQAEALMFQEALRKEKMVYNGIVQWLRSTSNSDEDNNGSPVGIDITGNFTCVDDRRIQLWENEQGFVKIVFHRQFHLVTTYIRPTVIVEQEMGTSVVKIYNLRIKLTEGLPKNERSHAIQMSGLNVALKCKFLSPEAAHLFLKAVLKYRDSTLTIFPENERPQNPSTSAPFIAPKTSQSPVINSTQQGFVPPPPPHAIQQTTNYHNVNQAIYIPNNHVAQQYTIPPPPPPPMNSMGRRAPAPSQLYQIPSHMFIQAPMPSPRSVFAPQSPLSATFQSQPLSPYTPAMSPQSIYSNPPHSIMSGMSPSGTAPLNAYFPPTVPSSPNPQANQSPISPKHSHSASFSHVRQNSLIHEHSNIVAELPADVPTPAVVPAPAAAPARTDNIKSLKNVNSEEAEDDFKMERAPTGLGGNIPISSTTPVKHQNSISMSKMFRKLR